MNWKGYIFIAVMALSYVLIGVGIGRELNSDINKQLYLEYQGLQSKYNDLKLDLESECYNSIYDVNKDGKINAQDYIITIKRAEHIKNIIMEG